MASDSSPLTGFRPAPDALVIFGALLSLAGYLLPWFKEQSGYDWSYSGWEYATLSSGGGWTLLTFGWLGLALVAGFWARSSAGAAMTAVVGAIGGLIFAVTVVAASFTEFPEQGSINWIAELPFGIGLPVMAAGFGILLAGGIRAVVRSAVIALSTP